MISLNRFPPRLTDNDWSVVKKADHPHRVYARFHQLDCGSAVEFDTGCMHISAISHP